jgi:RHO1 GDP-GTP exchange protein 1/2
LLFRGLMHHSSFPLATLKGSFRNTYEIYIKNYPLAESHYRNMLKQNRPYENFMQSVAHDPRIRKRDLITFLSRPVTRLPRLNLLLEQTLKLTSGEADHPDLETLPLILDILKECIKSTQPGIEVAESQVKFWALCESLVFQRGEIIVSNTQ